MIVVADTTPFSNFIRMGELDLLQKIFGEIIIPPSVYREVLKLSDFGYDLSSFQTADWIILMPIQNQTIVQNLLIDLDEGESEAIALAMETKADFLLIDEAEGRAKALSLGLDIVGSVGVLIKAKKLGLITVLKDYLDKLRVEAKFWLHQTIYDRVLEDAGELPN
jgi:uncharacterized protein